MTIKEIKKEIALIKELLELRGKLGGNTEVVTNITTNITGGLVPKTKPAVFGGTDLVDTFTPDTLKKYAGIYSVPAYTKEDKCWPSSEEAWKDVEKPFYNESPNCSCKF